jgi:ankyrin repeat protein
MYTPLDVYRFSNYSNLNELIIALDQGDNSSNWYRDELGHTALHCASLYGHINIVRTLIEKSDREILEIECHYGIKALSCATSR